MQCIELSSALDTCSISIDSLTKNSWYMFYNNAYSQLITSHAALFGGLIAFTVALFAFKYWVEYKKFDKDVKKIKKELDDVNQNVGSFKRELTDANQNVDKIKEELNKANQNVDKIKEELNGVNQNVGKIKEELNGVNQNVGKIKEELNEAHKKISYLEKTSIESLNQAPKYYLKSIIINKGTQNINKPLLNGLKEWLISDNDNSVKWLIVGKIADMLDEIKSGISENALDDKDIEIVKDLTTFLNEIKDAPTSDDIKREDLIGTLIDYFTTLSSQSSTTTQQSTNS